MSTAPPAPPDPRSYPATGMPDRDWWMALWPDPAGVLRSVGMRPGQRVLDLCCGDGYFTAPLARLVAPGLLAALDLSEEMLTRARMAVAQAGVSTVRWVAGDAAELEALAPGPYDRVLLANTLHGVPDPEALGRSVHAVLAPGGEFVVINWHARPREQTPVLGSPRGPRTELRLSPEETTRRLAPAGFIQVEVQNLGSYHYAVRYRRG